MSRIKTEAIRILMAFFILFLVIIQVNGQDLYFDEKTLPEVYDPVFGDRSIPGSRIVQLLHAGLYGENKNGVITPMVAAKFPLYNDTYTEATIELRKDIRWSDGTIITADDVVFSYILHNTMKSNFAEYLKDITEIEAINPHTVRVKLRSRDQSLQKNLIFYLLSKKQIGSPSYNIKAPFLTQPLTAGRYKLTTSSPISLEFTAHNWFDSEPAPNRVQTIQIDASQDESARFNDFSQMIKNFILDIPSVNLPDIKGLPQDFGFSPYAANEWACVVLNNEKPFFKIKEVRQAMTMLFNRQSAKTNFYMEKIDIITGPFTLGSPYYDVNLPSFEHDVNKALALLKRVGCTQQDGKLLFEGKPITLDLITSKMRMNSNDDRILSGFEATLENIGIEVKNYPINTHESFLTRIVKDKNFDMAFTYFQYPNDLSVITLFHSKYIASGFNYAQYQDPILDRMLDEFLSTSNPSLAIETGKKIHARLRDQAPVIFLWSYNRIAGYNYHQLQNVKLGKRFLFNSVTSWTAIK